MPDMGDPSVCKSNDMLQVNYLQVELFTGLVENEGSGNIMYVHAY